MHQRSQRRHYLTSFRGRNDDIILNHYKCKITFRTRDYLTQFPDHSLYGPKWTGSHPIDELKIGDIIVQWVVGTETSAATTSTHYLSSINDSPMTIMKFEWFRFTQPDLPSVLKFWNLFAAIVDHRLCRKKGRYSSRRAPESSRAGRTIGRTWCIRCIFQNWFPSSFDRERSELRVG